MPRTVPVVSLQNPNNIVSSALWNSGPKAIGDFYAAAPLFRGRQVATQVTTSGNWFAVALDTSTVDTESGHSNTVNNSLYVSQVAGWYLALGFVAWQNVNAQSPVYCALAVNTVLVPGTGQVLYKTGNDFSALSTSGLVHLNVGDFVQVLGKQTTGANMNTFAGTDMAPCMNLIWLHS